MDHRPFPKISQQGNPEVLWPSGTWVATEKLHGAQLVVATDGGQVRVGKRKAWLQDEDAFFGWQLLRKELEAAARQVHSAFGGELLVRLYGELFGGRYPHGEVRPMPGASPVQTGIWYAPDIHFALFDVLIETGDQVVFLAHHELEGLARRAGILLVPLLMRGPRAELERLSPRFPTLVPSTLGLPPLADNFAEGMVLKPDQRSSPEKRPVIKRKLAEFDEQRFDESMPWNADALLSLQELRVLGKNLVNPPRIASARSKVGPSSDHELCEEISLDVVVDLQSAFPRAASLITPEEEQALLLYLREVAREALGLPGRPNVAV